MKAGRKFLLHLCLLLLFPPDESRGMTKSGTEGLGGAAGSCGGGDSGRKRNANRFPFLVLIQLTRDGKRETCGGSIVREDFVVTAATCVYRALGHSIRIYAGNGEKGGEQRSGVYRIIMHPQFDGVQKRNDIALLALSQPFFFTQALSFISLASAEREGNVSGSAWVSAWGRSSWFKSTLALQTAALNIISNAECAEHYAKSRFFRNLLSGENICAKSPGRSVCFVDEGAPLSVVMKGMHVLVGISSWVESCARPTLPAVFVRISEYVHWIIHMMDSDL